MPRLGKGKGFLMKDNPRAWMSLKDSYSPWDLVLYVADGLKFKNLSGQCEV